MTSDFYTTKQQLINEYGKVTCIIGMDIDTIQAAIADPNKKVFGWWWYGWEWCKIQELTEYTQGNFPKRLPDGTNIRVSFMGRAANGGFETYAGYIEFFIVELPPMLGPEPQPAQTPTPVRKPSPVNTYPYRIKVGEKHLNKLSAKDRLVFSMIFGATSSTEGVTENSAKYFGKKYYSKAAMTRLIKAGLIKKLSSGNLVATRLGSYALEARRTS